MTNAPGETDGLRAVIARIDLDHPLRVPLTYNVGHVSPRLDRLEAKLAYLADYVAFLEQRIDKLEGRVVS